VIRALLLSLLAHGTLAALLVLPWALGGGSRENLGQVEIYVTGGGGASAGEPARPENAAPRPRRTRSLEQGPLKRLETGGEVGGAGPSSGQGPGLGDAEAQAATGIAPIYPALSRQLGEEGRVELSLEIAADGFVSMVTISRSSGYPRLDEAARVALTGARFHAARRNGSAVASTKKLTVEFRLRE
jgi:periplasmic protein TonB